MILLIFVELISKIATYVKFSTDTNQISSKFQSSLQDGVDHKTIGWDRFIEVIKIKFILVDFLNISKNDGEKTYQYGIQKCANTHHLPLFLAANENE